MSPAAPTPEHWVCGECGSDDLTFVRTLCACGVMHHYCGDCGVQDDPCAPAAPTPGEVPNIYGAANSTNPAAVPVVGRAAELAATVQEALDFSKGVTGQEQITVALAALSELEALAAEWEIVASESQNRMSEHAFRADRVEHEATALATKLIAAESRVTKLERALWEIGHGVRRPSPRLPDALRAIARAALAAGEEGA